jgi:transposase
MFFRLKHNAAGPVLQLVESYRDAESRPRQRIMVSLGDPEILPKDWKLLAKMIERRLRGEAEDLFDWDCSESLRGWADRIVHLVDQNQKSWTPRRNRADAEVPSPAAAAPAETVDGVIVDKVSHEHTATLGPVLAGRHAWSALGMDNLLQELGFNQSQALAAAAQVINRLVDPQSENALGDWVRSTAVPELFGAGIAQGGRDRFYRVADLLWKKRKKIEAHLRARHRQLFSLQRTLVLYDLTNTYFEGRCAANPKARRGHSKHKRNDCPQIVVGMVFDENGFPLSHRIYEGNQSDSPTLMDMVKSLQETLKNEPDLFAAKPLIILDGGLASRKNLEAIREAGMRYLVNDSRNGRKAYAEYFREDDQFEIVGGRDGRRPVRVRQMVDPAGTGDTLLLCKSEGRAEKEAAIRSNAQARLEKDLVALEKRVASGRLKETEKIDQAIGRVLGKHPRAARLYTVEKTATEQGLRIAWRLREEEQGGAVADDLFGCYVLRGMDAKWERPDAMWGVYMTLTGAEDGFRMLKSNLGMRPNRHHIEQRVDSHVFICILAYHLLRVLMFTLESQGDQRSWPTIKRILSTHAYTTIVMPTTASGTIRIRKAGTPDEVQRGLYGVWGIDWRALPTIKTRHTAGRLSPGGQAPNARFGAAESATL